MIAQHYTAQHHQNCESHTIKKTGGAQRGSFLMVLAMGMVLPSGVLLAGVLVAGGCVEHSGVAIEVPARQTILVPVCIQQRFVFHKRGSAHSHPYTLSTAWERGLFIKQSKPPRGLWCQSVVSALLAQVVPC